MNLQEFDEAALAERLQAFKQALVGEAAPDRVEAAVLAEFRQRRSGPAIHWRPRWALAAAAVVLAVAAATLVFRPSPPAQPMISAPAPLAEVAGIESPPRPASPAPVKTVAEASDFIPLVPGDAWMPGETGQILRVSMPRSALVSFGLPVDENRAFETVRADLVVGQDMVARAIRIVR